jgi:hypothetical protein
LIGRHAVAPLRPRPFGPPLRGRATLRNGMTTGGPERLPGHETERVGFHLRNAARWSKIGGRRRLYADHSVSVSEVRPISYPEIGTMRHTTETLEDYAYQSESTS